MQALFADVPSALAKILAANPVLKQNAELLRAHPDLLSALQPMWFTP